MNNIKEAFNKPGVVVDRWVLRLGKNSEEAGRFQPWFLPSSTFEQDFSGFVACLNLLKIVDTVKERMSTQKKGVREIKKQQKIEQKEIAKMKAKVEKAAEKAQLKLDRAAEKERIKQDAKAAREQAKNMGRPKPDNEVPGQAEDTTNVAIEKASESVVVVQSVLQTMGQTTIYEDFPVERKPYVIPEEG